MKSILLTGASGFLGSHVLDALRADRDLIVTTAGRTAPRDSARHEPLDLLELDEIPRVLGEVKPDVVIHAAALADVTDCERDPQLAERINLEATKRIASCAANLGTSLVFISTDQVFDGRGSWYQESNPTGAVNVYGRTKTLAERAVRRILPEASIVRLALVIGPSRGERISSSDQILRAIREGRTPRLFTDEYRTPIHVSDAARIIVELAQATSPPPLLHLAGPDRLSRYDLGHLLVSSAGLPVNTIQPATHAEVRPWPTRPADVSLDTALLRSWSAYPPRPVREAVRACRMA